MTNSLISEGKKVQYLYDIWVNWFDGEEEGYNVCAYHEWRKSDNIEMVDQIPVIYISEQLFTYIENSLSPLPNELLNLIHKKTYIRKGYSRRVVEYACIVSDGRRIIAFDTLGYDIPLRKSRLIPRQERQVYEICEKRKVTEFPVPKLIPIIDFEWKIDEQFMYGLTRRERELKKLLLIGLEQLKYTKNKREISYWLSEWEGRNTFITESEMSVEQMWQRLYDEAISDWSVKHEEFLSQLLRGNPILENFWEKEQIANKNKENQK
jgi:hypothetical protein